MATQDGTRHEPRKSNCGVSVDSVHGPFKALADMRYAAWEADEAGEIAAREMGRERASESVPVGVGALIIRADHHQKLCRAALALRAILAPPERGGQFDPNLTYGENIERGLRKD